MFTEQATDTRATNNKYFLFRFIQYNPTSLERNYKHDVLTEVDLGVPIDLILPETYSSQDSTGHIGILTCY